MGVTGLEPEVLDLHCIKSFLWIQRELHAVWWIIKNEKRDVADLCSLLFSYAWWKPPHATLAANPPKPLCGIKLYDICGSAASIWKSIVFPTVSKECNA